MMEKAVESGKKKHYRNTAEQAKLVEAWRSSGLSMREFSEANDLHPKALSRWVSKLSGPQGFAKVSPTATAKPATLRLCLPQGYQLAIPVGSNPSYVAQLIKALEG